MKCGAGIFGNKSEESLPPGIIGVTEQIPFGSHWTLVLFANGKLLCKLTIGLP
jgi:hypothetical protein